MGGFFERPKGIRICSCLMRPETPLEKPPDGTTVKFINLRAIPVPEPDKKSSLLELAKMDTVQHPIEMWAGQGNCCFIGASEFDPWHHLSIIHISNSIEFTANFRSWQKIGAQQFHELCWNIQNSLRDHFAISVSAMTLNNFRHYLADYYKETYDNLLGNIT